ncbi:hypothetical protein LTR04_003882 [Oleoguttula sp. CCFEE 6159]|nr:hypothetical protein LTR04_003882 [Oleoguttula sp. CCFEE 6159]
MPNQREYRVATVSQLGLPRRPSTTKLPKPITVVEPAKSLSSTMKPARPVQEIRKVNDRPVPRDLVNKPRSNPTNLRWTWSNKATDDLPSTIHAQNIIGVLPSTISPPRRPLPPLPSLQAPAARPPKDLRKADSRVNLRSLAETSSPSPALDAWTWSNLSSETTPPSSVQAQKTVHFSPSALSLPAQTSPSKAAIQEPEVRAGISTREIDRLARALVDAPAVQMSVRGQHWDHSLPSSTTASSKPTTDCTTLVPSSSRLHLPNPLLFASLCITSAGVAGHPVEWHSAGFRPGTNVLQVGACTYLNLPYGARSAGELRTQLAPDGRPAFFLQIVKAPVGWVGNRGDEMLVVEVEVTDAVRGFVGARAKAVAAAEQTDEGQCQAAEDEKKVVEDDVDDDDDDDDDAFDWLAFTTAGNEPAQLAALRYFSPAALSTFSSFDSAIAEFLDHVAGISSLYDDFFVLSPPDSTTGRSGAKRGSVFGHGVTAVSQLLCASRSLLNGHALRISPSVLRQVERQLVEGKAECRVVDGGVEKRVYCVPLGDGTAKGKGLVEGDGIGDVRCWVCFLVKGE